MLDQHIFYAIFFRVLLKKKKKKLFYFLRLHSISPMGLRIAFPAESQLQQSRAPQPTVHAGSFSVCVIQRTLTLDL